MRGAKLIPNRMGDYKNSLRKAMRAGGVNVAFDHGVPHDATDDICALAFRGAENQRMPEQVALIDECTGADSLAFARIFEGVV